MKDETSSSLTFLDRGEDIKEMLELPSVDYIDSRDLLLYLCKVSSLITYLSGEIKTIDMSIQYVSRFNVSTGDQFTAPLHTQKEQLISLYHRLYELHYDITERTVGED